MGQTEKEWTGGSITSVFFHLVSLFKKKKEKKKAGLIWASVICNQEAWLVEHLSLQHLRMEREHVGDSIN